MSEVLGFLPFHSLFSQDILIALLALVRRFIVLDLYQTEPSTVAALAGAALALGIVFWLVRSQECSDETGEGQEPHLPLDC